MNEYGRFNEKGEFVVTRPDTPRPWLNFVTNEALSATYSQTGSGTLLWKGSGGVREVLPSSERDEYAPNGRLLYLRDIHSGEVWSPTWQPRQTALESFEALHGFKRSVISGVTSGVQCEVTFSLRGSCEHWQVKIKNLHDERRRMQLVVAATIGSGTPAETFRTGNSIVVLPRADNDVAYYFYSAKEPHSFETFEDRFVGAYGNYSKPLSVEKPMLGKNTGLTTRPLAAFSLPLSLGPQSEATLDFYCGAVETGRATKNEIAKKVAAAVREAAKVKSAETDRSPTLEHFKAITSDREFNKYHNGFQAEQVFNQSSSNNISQGAVVWATPELTTNALLGNLLLNEPAAANWVRQLCERQNSDGSWTTFWQENEVHHQHHRAVTFSLTAVRGLITYLKYFGLEQASALRFPYYDATEAALGEHLNRAFHYLEKSFEQRPAENDELQDPATLAELAFVFREAVALLEQSGHHHLSQKYERTAEKIRVVINKQKPNSLDAQVWPILAKAVDPKRAETVVTKLAKSSFPHPLPAVPESPTGGDLPGEGTNGAVDFMSLANLAAAACEVGNGDAAWRLYKQIVPIYQGVNAERYQREPYLQAGWANAASSSSAGKATRDYKNYAAPIYLTCWEKIFGIQPGYTGLKIDPCIPADWRNVELSYHWRGADYHFRIQNPFRVRKGIDRVIVDGIRLTGNVIRPFRTGSHFVEVILG